MTVLVQVMWMALAAIVGLLALMAFAGLGDMPGVARRSRAARAQQDVRSVLFDPVRTESARTDRGELR